MRTSYHAGTPAALIGLLVGSWLGLAGAASAESREEATAIRQGFTMIVATHLVSQDIDASARGFDPAAESRSWSPEFGFGAFLDPDWSVSCVVFYADGDSKRLQEEFPFSGIRNMQTSLSSVAFAVENWNLAPLSLSASVGLSVFRTNWSITREREPIVGNDSGVSLEVGASHGLYRLGRHRVELRAALGHSFFDDMGISYARFGVGYRLF